MSLEAGTFVRDLDESNPPGTDKKKQGDDHLRLVKKVARGTFPNATKAFMFPSSAVKTADFTILGPGVSGTDTTNNMNAVFLVDTTALAVNATLPVLTTTDAGWECSFIKTNTGTNPLFIVPATGTIQSGEIAGLTKTRRSIPGRRTRVVWTGTAWIAERVVGQPIGSIMDLGLATALPVGFEWPDGTSLSSSANYPDYFALLGSLVKPERRGLAVFGRDNMGIGAAGRLSVTIAGATVGTIGGNERLTILQTDLPNVTLGYGGVSGSGGGAASANPSQGIVVTGVPNGSAILYTPGAAGATSVNPPTSLSAIQHQQGQTSSINSGTAQSLMNKLPPAVIANMVVVVE